MKNTTILALMAALSISACGGGGGGGDGGGGNPPSSNSIPNISGSPLSSINAGQTYLFTPVASDADGDTLTFSIENAPFWAMFDSATGALSGTPFAAHLGDYADIIISVTDGKATARLAAFALTVTPQQLGEANFVASGDIFPTANGYQSVGTLTMNTGEREQTFENSDLTLEFDAEGNLLDIFGETDLPPELSDNVSVDAGVRAVVGMMTGAEINADPSFGIKLMDEISYFVFLLDAGIDLTVSNPADPTDTENVTLETPASGQIVIIMDPTDPMLYRFGSQPLLGELGTGESYNGLIPFKPEMDFAGLDSFNGHVIVKGKIGIAIKGVIDLFEVDGWRVTKEPQFGDIDWTDPLSSPIEYRTGINGTATFGLGVLGVGLFNFADAELSTTLDVGFDRQHAALAFFMAADVVSANPFVPDWFHVVPNGDMGGEALINGDGDFAFGLAGTFQSTVPPANVGGSMYIDNSGVTLEAMTTGDGETLAVSMAFLNNETVGRVAFPESYAASITSDVSAALDRELAAVQQSIQDLQDATADYEFEASLRGIRTTLPPTMDAAITLLNSLPGTVYTRAYNAAIDVMANTCKTVTVIVSVTYCLDDVVNEVSIARDIATKARSETATGIVSGINAMRELKARALEADDETLREALRLALAGVYDRRTYTRRVKVTRTFSVFPFKDVTYTLYDETYTRKILSNANATSVATARDNVWRIQATSDIMISAQQIFDQLPTEEVIASVKQEVDDGITAVPIPDGLGYRAINDTYEAFITVDGVDHITEINVLSPSDVQTGVSDLLADLLLGGG